MSSSPSVPFFDASNSHVFEEGVEREAAAGRRDFFNENLGQFVVFPAFFVVIAYALLTSDLPTWQTAAVMAAMATVQVIMVVMVVRTFRRPRAHPVRVMSDGTLVVGRRSLDLRSVEWVEHSGHMLTFRRADGRGVLSVFDYQAGDLGSFMSAVGRVAPGVELRRDEETNGPHFVRLSKV